MDGKNWDDDVVALALPYTYCQGENAVGLEAQENSLA
jgi:hypothetical protein